MFRCIWKNNVNIPLTGLKGVLICEYLNGFNIESFISLSVCVVIYAI